MINALILIHLIKVPFITSPIIKSEFPILVENLNDTPGDFTITSAYNWISDNEIRESLPVDSELWPPSAFILDASGAIREKRIGYEFSDSNLFIEKYEYKNGNISNWFGRFNSAKCFFKNGNVDSIHIVNTDQEDSQTYYFKMEYDSLQRLVQADRVTIVPNNNPGPDKRTKFIYTNNGDVSVKTFSMSAAADTLYKILIIKEGHLIEIISPTKANGKEFNRIKRFSYPSTLKIVRRKVGSHLKVWRSKGSSDALGRVVSEPGFHLITGT
jgi:hypothetical protein